MDTQKIKFNLPGMYEHTKLNIYFLNLLKNHPNYFYDNVKINSVYGNFQFCIFDGGRIFNKYNHASMEKIEDLIDQYNYIYNTAIRLIFTNPVITKEYFNDRFSNIILKLCNNGKNEIVINNNELKKYIQDKYSNYTFISSTTKCLNNGELLKEELNNSDYSLVCLDYNLNHNKKLLESLNQEQKNKCEFLVNAICPAGCVFRKQHYDLNGYFSLTYGQPYTMPGCSIEENTLAPNLKTRANTITPEELYNYYYKKNFNNFKLEGRTLGFSENLCNFVKYLIKPEYTFFIINEALKYFKIG